MQKPRARETPEAGVSAAAPSWDIAGSRAPFDALGETNLRCARSSARESLTGRLDTAPVNKPRLRRTDTIRSCASSRMAAFDQSDIGENTARITSFGARGFGVVTVYNPAMRRAPVLQPSIGGQKPAPRPSRRRTPPSVPATAAPAATACGRARILRRAGRREGFHPVEPHLQALERS